MMNFIMIIVLAGAIIYMSFSYFMNDLNKIEISNIHENITDENKGER